MGLTIQGLHGKVEVSSSKFFSVHELFWNFQFLGLQHAYDTETRTLYLFDYLTEQRIKFLTGLFKPESVELVDESELCYTYYTNHFIPPVFYMAGMFNMTLEAGRELQLRVCYKCRKLFVFIREAYDYEIVTCVHCGNNETGVIT